MNPLKTISLNERVSPLKSTQVIHSDLAARNILVFEGLTVKITDFGLSKNLYESSFYSRRHQQVFKPCRSNLKMCKNSEIKISVHISYFQVRLPWPWMAPESLELLTFSVHSDVWSFGVTAWEIFTLGQVPFAAHNWTTEFMRRLTQEGLRLSKPARALEEMYVALCIPNSCSLYCIETVEYLDFFQLRFPIFVLEHKSLGSPIVFRNQNIFPTLDAHQFRSL